MPKSTFRMKYYRLLSLILFFILYSTHIYSHKNNPILDSLLRILENENTVFDEKYKLDSVVVNAQSLREYRPFVLNKLTLLARKEKKLDKLLSLYTGYATFYISRDSLKLARLYLDSAALYTDKVDSVRLSNYFYTEGNYFASMQEYDRAYYYYHEAINVTERSDKNYNFIIGILRNMIVYHFNRDDVKEVKNVIDMMNAIPKPSKVDSRMLFTIDEVTAGYYATLHWKTRNNVYLDSAQIYYKHAIDLYESIDSLDQKRSSVIMLMIYSRYAEMEIDKVETNWELVQTFLSKAKKLRNPNDQLRLAILNVLEASVCIANKEFEKGIQLLQESQDIIDKIGVDVPEYKNEYLDIYRKYIDLYKSKNDYVNALKYIELLNDLKWKYQEENNNKLITELDIKYATSQKDLEISRLNERESAIRLKNILVLSFSLFFIILLFIAFLYNRLKRLKKEKEAAQLLVRFEQKDNEYTTLINETEHRLTKRYLEGRELERKMLAKELHDSVANEIVSIIMQNNSNAKRESVSCLLKETYNHVRQISHQLMPPDLKYISLPEMIEDYISVLNETSSVHFKFIASEGDKAKSENLKEHTSKELYYIIQEVISNILKHANTKEAEVSLFFENQNLILSIVDYGIGFNINRRSRGIGLLTIRDRCKEIGAEIKIESVYGKGTNFFIVLINVEQHLLG